MDIEVGRRGPERGGKVGRTKERGAGSGKWRRGWLVIPSFPWD